MTKLDEMWAALASYQPQADAAGHGKSWARMCSERTSDLAYAAGDAAATYADSAAAAYDAAYAAAAVYYAAYAYADDWAQKAIDRIKEITNPPAAQPVGQAPCVRHCESTAYEIVIRGLKGDIERLKAAQRKPLTDDIWILTSEYNDYDQHGEYFEAVFVGKPTAKQIEEHCGVNEIGSTHILAGGGRIKHQDQWYNLRQEEAAHGIKENT
jgi:hypothetical protein